MKHKPTEQQQNIIDHCVTGKHLIIEAGAGCAKTSSLEMIAEVLSPKRGLYLAFNKSIADDAARRFPSNVRCQTAHSLAFAAVGKYFSHRLSGSHLGTGATGQILCLEKDIQLSCGKVLSPFHLHRIVLDTVRQFCYSADPEISTDHIPFLEALPSESQEELAQMIEPALILAWGDLSSPHGQLKFSHDVYFKLWSLQRPIIPYDFLMVDEYQDTNAALEFVIGVQTCQVVVVGDSNQSIYAWRGCIDALGKAQGTRLPLTHSYRFGQGIADCANEFLHALGTSMRLVGKGQLSTIKDLSKEPVDAILCRTNATVFSEAAACLNDGNSVGISGGTEQLKLLAYAADKLKKGQHTIHPDLFLFKSWEEVEDHVKKEPRSELKPLVSIINRYSVQGVLGILDRMDDENYAKTVVSTVHRAKGKEWGKVRIASDFEEQDSDTQDRAELMLAYVAVTRAKEVLDYKTLSWIKQFFSN